MGGLGYWRGNIHMSLNLQQIISSPLAVNFASSLAKIIPPRLGYPLCDLLGTWIAARRYSMLTRAVRTNQWVARGTHLEKQALDRAVQETFQHNARDLYTLYHNIQHPERVQNMIVTHSSQRELIARPEFASRGLVIVGLHLSNFDLVLQSAAQQGLKAMVLTIPNPQGGRRVEYEMRKRTGMNLVPASISALKQAVQHLVCGGVVLTGLDRPVREAKHCPKFFGYPASLPTHHISLALKAHVPILMMAAIQQADGKYHVLNSDPIEMEQDADHGKAIIRNAEHVLKQAEAFIRMAPEQWNVPLPVWPELLDITPG